MSYIPFTEEEKQRANSVDLVDFLQRQGEQLIRSGHEWRWKRHDSVTIRGSEWFRHSRKEGGHAIDFVQRFYDMDFPEAVTFLLGGEGGLEWNQTEKSAPPPKKDFALPEANPDMRRVFAYLLKQRFIDPSVLSYFAREHLIYEDKEYHNAVFVGVDENSIPRHAHKRGTYTKGEPYKGNVEGSDPKYSFHYIGEDDTLYVFEAPIDMLSFISLHLKDWQKHSYVTLDGVSEHAMLQQLKSHPNLKNIVLCLDHDEAGIEATGRLKDILAEHDYYDPAYMDIPVLQSRYKDWNEDIKAKHGITPIPAGEHPKLVLLPEICENLSSVCETLSAVPDPAAVIREYHRRLTPLVDSEKLAAANSEIVGACLQKMAAGALLSAQRELRQMERPETVGQLIGNLRDSYRPHLDRGWMRTKAADIREDAVNIDRQSLAPGIRTLQDRQTLVSDYMRLALDCIKAQLFVRLELSQPLQAPKESALNFKMSL
ncbi:MULTISPECIES: DUF3991 and toprim domain-containing protein [Eubacteriales]|jgi:hypothetical protein|uniref:DUF3991 domain-containing protein n=1 Tax=Caproicibacterium amylolyticum TaxID=2766537 RepID=A0A7G9WG03_9FIRM|nr:MULTISPECIES: DUF3991 and toprim domain-containing protein [Eubacteriales]QNO17615.1 DUF3991 domain-containing protein [Caproicibacterium amylolyticum]